MKRLYLVLAIVGAVLPYLFFPQFLINHGIDLPRFVSALFVNPPASGITSDLLISSFVFWIMMFQKKITETAPTR